MRSGPTANDSRQSMQGTRDRQLHICELPPSARASRSRGLRPLAFLGGRAALDRSDMHGGAAGAKKMLHFWAKDDDGSGGGADTPSSTSSPSPSPTDWSGCGGGHHRSGWNSRESRVSSHQHPRISAHRHRWSASSYPLALRSFGPHEIDSRSSGWGLTGDGRDQTQAQVKLPNSNPDNAVLAAVRCKTGMPCSVSVPCSTGGGPL